MLFSNKTSILAVKLVLYINGKIVAEDTTYETTSASPTAHPDLIIGAGTLYPLVNDHWAIQLDDLAIWDGYLLKHEEVVYVMNQGIQVCNVSIGSLFCFTSNLKALGRPLLVLVDFLFFPGFV